MTLVVPIYNVAPYLQECLDSIVCQSTFDQIEVILVDDGSTDGSSEIALHFAQSHENSRLITQQNAGLGAARNRGMDDVATPYVMFCDSDDRLPCTSVESLHRALVENDADVAVGRMQTFPSRTVWPWLKYFDGSTTVLEGIESAPDLIHGASACNKIFRMSDICEQGLQFAEGSHFEDIYVTIPVLLRAKRIALVPEVVYDYRKRDHATSIMDSLWDRPENYWDHLRAEEFVAELRESIPTSRRSVAELFMTRSFQGFLRRAPQTLPLGDLRTFFGRAALAFKGISPDAISSGCLDARHRLPYLALITSDFEFFRDPQSRLAGLAAEDGALRFNLANQVSEDLKDLAVADRVVAYLETVEVLPKGKGLRVAGTFRIDGFEPRNGPPAELGVRVRGSGVTVAALPLRRRADIEAKVSATWSGFVADIPGKRLKDGSHLLRLVFKTPTGQASTRLRPTVGVRRSSRVVRIAGRHASIGLDRFGNAVLSVCRTDTKLRKLRWRGSRLWSDLSHIARGQPLWRERLLRLVTAPVLRKRDIWLLVERGDTAQDNSFFLFRHLRTCQPQRNAYYVITQQSPQRSKLQGLGHVVTHGSLRHRALMLNATWLIGSYDIDSYMLPAQWDRNEYLTYLAPRVGSRRAFLQHGVTYNDVSRALRSATTGVDVFVVSSEREASFVRDEMCYPVGVAVCGMPRFDSLERTDAARRILLMPTWRSWLVQPSYATRKRNAEPFEGSTYSIFFAQLLNHPELLHCLEEFDAELEVLPHYEFADSFNTMMPEHPRVRLSHHSTRDTQQALRDCSLFVTDWSSTLFDAAYLRVPQVLVPFDEAEFRLRQYKKGYFDLERDGFGPVAKTVEAAVGLIVGYVHGGWHREECYSRRADEFFAFADHSSCERVVAAIAGARKVRRSLPPPEAWGL